MKGRLNLFQATMLRWRDQHPYSAVHVVQLAGTLDATRLARALGDEVEDCGLTGLVLDNSRMRYEYTGGRSQVPLVVHDGGEDPHAVLFTQMERELNRPFSRDGRIEPFRGFAVTGADVAWFALAYDHFIAGGDSIVRLMQGIAARYANPQTVGSGTIERYPPTYRHVFLRNLGPAIRSLAAMPRLALACRRSHRPRYEDWNDRRNELEFVTLDAADTGRLLATAKRWGVTVNDALLAISLQLVAPFTQERLTARRRVELGVASIMNLRRDFGGEGVPAFGQFLGSLRVSHPLPRDTTLERLAQDVHAETQRVKRRKLYFATLLGMAWTGLIWRMMSEESRVRFHARNYPVWVGVTLLNVNALWQRDGGEDPPAYLRAVSTGPLTPIVLAVTTAGPLMHVGFTYRATAFTRENVSRMAADFTALVRTLPP